MRVAIRAINMINGTKISSVREIKSVVRVKLHLYIDLGAVFGFQM